MVAKNNPNELHITRIYDAPVQAVWDAWVDPDQVAQWWGPRGFTITTYSKDVRTGGSWHYTMHGPDGVDYENTAQYLLVEEGKKMVYDHGGHKDRPPLFRVTVLFTEVDGKTKMDMTMSMATPEMAEEIKKRVKQANGNSTWDRLAEFLADRSSKKSIFVINRSFNAPLDVLFEMWTNPKHFSQWLPPTGATMEFLRADIRTGGQTFYSMTTATGAKMYGRIDYQQIRKPDLIVYTQVFCDEKENISRHLMAPTWPETMLTIIQLTEEAPDQTRVTVTWEPYGATTAAEVETFLQARSGMTQGWTGSFDKLDELLSQQPSAATTN